MWHCKKPDDRAAAHDIRQTDRQTNRQRERIAGRQSGGKLTSDCISRATEVGLIAQRWSCPWQLLGHPFTAIVQCRLAV